MKTVFVLGATGATGRLLARELLERGCVVKAVVRSADRIPKDIRDRARFACIEGSVLHMGKEALKEILSSCDAVVSCLGHNISFKGIFGPPHLLVYSSIRKVIEAVKESDPASKKRFVLMNSTGCQNKLLNEKVPFIHAVVIALLRVLIPPHRDNEKALAYLNQTIKADSSFVEWAAVRPDALIDEDTKSTYTLHSSPTRSAILDPGKTSRINVASFIGDLILRDEVWDEWKFKTPVIYNTSN